MMLLIGLMAGLSIPFFSRSLDILTAKTTLREIAAVQRRARSLAISEKHTFAFHLDISDKNYFIVQENRKTSEENSSKKILHKKLDDKIIIQGFLESDESDLQTEGKIKILFYPQGNSSGGTIILEIENDERGFAVITDRLSGRVLINIDSDE